MTEKLYYKDAYIKEFYASVISVEKCDEGYDVVLDKTAFFPEEGGQSSDDGRIGTSNVVRVYEKDGVVHHITDADITENTVFCNKLNVLLRNIGRQTFGSRSQIAQTAADSFLFPGVSITVSVEDDPLMLGKGLADEIVESGIKIIRFFQNVSKLA